MKKKIVTQLLAITLCAALLAGSLTGCGFQKKLDTQTVLTKILEEEIDLNSARHIANGQNSKDETVYVFTDATGRQTKLTVNEKLTNGLAQDTIEDVSTLQGIVNLTGDESFTQGADDAITWNLSEGSLTYQGTCDKQVPIETKITYYLDGAEISPENLAGKSGHVTIRFDFTNHQTKTVKIGDKEKEICVPFTMVTGMVLPSDKFWNIEVTNGKVSDIKDDSLILGITMPGLQKSLDMQLEDEKLDLNIPDYFEVSADTQNFEIESIMSIATSSLLTDLDVSDLSIDSLTDQMGELQEAADEITDGTVDLQDGTGKLSEGANKLKDGIALLSGKVPELTDGVKKLDNGAGELVNGCDKLSSGTGDLVKGANQAKDGSGKVSDGAKKVSDGTKQVSDGADQLSDGAKQLSDGASQVSDGAKKVSDGAKQLSDGASQASEGADTLNDGIKTYTEGVDTIAAGAKSLNDNMVAYAAGMQQFYDALAKSDTPLDKSMAALLSGANQLNGGSQQLKTQLSDGINQAAAQYTQAYTGFYQIAVGFVATANQVDTETAATLLANNGITSEADVTNTNQMAIATGFLMENYSNIIALQIADQNSLVTIVSGLSQAYQAYSLTAGTLNQLSDAGYFDGMNNLAGGINSLATKVGSFDEEKDGTICTTIAKLNASASQLQTQGTAPINDGLKKVSDNSNALREGASQLNDGCAALSTGASDLYKGASDLYKGTSDLSTGASNLYSGASDLSKGASDLYNGASDLSKGASDLNDGIGALADGASQINNGVGQLRNGLGTLKDGTTKLNTGAGTLANGTTELMDGANALADGAISLNGGAITLKDGMIKFNNEGISKLSNLVDSDANELIDTLKAVIESGKDYQSFAGKKDGMDGSVVFIYKIDGITVEK